MSMILTKANARSRYSHGISLQQHAPAYGSVLAAGTLGVARPALRYPRKLFHGEYLDALKPSALLASTSAAAHLLEGKLSLRVGGVAPSVLLNVGVLVVVDTHAAMPQTSSEVFNNARFSRTANTRRARRGSMDVDTAREMMGNRKKGKEILTK